LGLITRFAEVVNDNLQQYSVFEQKRCLKAIEELVIIGKNYTRSARPQVLFTLFFKLFYKYLL